MLYDGNVQKQATGADNNHCMKVKSPISEKVYRVELIFSETTTKVGEEIRDILKEKYIRGEIGAVPGKWRAER